MKLFFVFILFSLSFTGFSQEIKFDYDPVPHESGFKMDGYWVWCGSMIWSQPVKLKNPVKEED